MAIVPQMVTRNIALVKPAHPARADLAPNITKNKIAQVY